MNYYKALLISSALAALPYSGAKAQPTYMNDVTVNGQTYSIYTERTTWDGFRVDADAQPWWKNEALAKEFAFQQSSFSTGGPAFIYGPSIGARSSSAIIPTSSTQKWTWYSREYDIVQDIASATKSTAIQTKAIESAGNITGGNGNNKSSNLGSLLSPEFQGGTLTVDQANATYKQDFTLPQDGTIDTAGNRVNFTGSFAGTGTLTITNSTSGKSSNLDLGSSSNPIVLGGLNTSASNSNEFLAVDLIGEADVRGDTIVNHGSIAARGKFSTDNLTITAKPAFLSSFIIGPTDSNHKTTVRNNLSIKKRGVLNTTSSSVANPVTTTEILLTAGTVNASQGSTIRLGVPSVIETRNSSVINGTLDGGGGAKDFDDLGTFSKPITWKGAGETIFSPSSTVLLRSTTNTNRPLTAPDFLVQGKIEINTNNFKLSRYTINPFVLDASNGNLVVDTTGELSGIGTISANVINNGLVRPGGGGSIGTLTVDGDFTQSSSGSLEIEIDVANHSNDLLKITGANRSLDLDGTLAISTFAGQAITPNVAYTAVTAPKGTSENISITSNFSGVAANSGFVFVRESDAAYANLDQNYYDACKSNKANCTDVRFGWLQRTTSKTPNKGPSHIKPVTVAQTTAPVLTTTKLPGKQTIQQVKPTGGALTTAISGHSGTNTAICAANTNNSKTCNSTNQKGTGSSGHNTNNVNIAQTIDAGKTSAWVGITPAIISHPSTGSTQVITPNTNQEQTLVSAAKPTVRPHKESGGYVVQIKTDPKSKKPQTQTIVVTKKPTIVKNPDGTHTTTFHPSGGRSIKNAHGHETGINTEQAKVAGVTPDFIKVANSLLSIPTRKELNRALHAISAEPYASMQSVALEAIEQFGKNSLALTDRAVPLSEPIQICERDDGSRMPAADLDPSEECKLRTIKRPQRWSLMVDAANTEASLDGTNDLASFDYDIFSTIVGLQYAISPQWSVGGSFGYGRANLSNYEYANSRIESDTYAGSIWGTYKPSPDWRITGQLGLMGLDYSSSRAINLPGINRVAEADWNGTAWLATLATDYTWALGDNKDNPNAIKLRPNLFVTYASHHQGRFTETGADSLNLEMHSHTADSLLAGLGMELELPIVLNSTNRIIPRFYVGYEHDFMGDTNQEHELKSEFAKLPALGSVDVLGQNRGSDDLDLALSIELETSDSISIFGNVGGSFWSNGSELSYGGGVRVRW